MFVKFVVLLSSALFASGALNDFAAKIVGGDEVDIAEVPWQASLRINGRYWCGASIIGRNWLLTAAHCTVDVIQNPGGLTVRVGSTNKAIGGHVHRVENIYQHEMFNSKTLDFDYSLLELEDSIEFNNKTQPITLVDADRQFRDGTKCLVTGWGKTESGRPSELLRRAVIPIVNQQKCANNYRRSTIGIGITPSMICAGLGGKDSCKGDSGGPLVSYDRTTQKDVQIGVVSWGQSVCGLPNYPGVYASLTVVRDWIYETSGI